MSGVSGARAPGRTAIIATVLIACACAGAAIGWVIGNKEASEVVRQTRLRDPEALLDGIPFLIAGATLTGFLFGIVASSLVITIYLRRKSAARPHL